MTKPAWQLRKNSQDQLAASDEARLREADRIAIKERAVRDFLGKKTPSDQRVNAHDDEEIFLALQGAFALHKSVRFTSRWSPEVIYKGSTRDPKKVISGFIIDEDEVDSVSVWVPAWKHTGDRLKTLAWIMVMDEEGDKARTLNLNLGAEVIEMARNAKAKRGVGFARFIRERLSKHLRRALSPLGLEAPEFFFWVEAVDIRKAHLHGAIVIPDHATPNKVMKAIREALKAAGGNWNDAEHENQVHLVQMHHPLGWSSYISKWKKLTRLRIQDSNTVAASGGIRSRAAAWYMNARATGDPITSRTRP